MQKWQCTPRRLTEQAQVPQLQGTSSSRWLKSRENMQPLTDRVSQHAAPGEQDVVGIGEVQPGPPHREELHTLRVRRLEGVLRDARHHATCVEEKERNPLNRREVLSLCFTHDLRWPRT